MHEQERSQHGKRQRDGDYENGTEMPQKQNVGQRNKNDLLDQRMLESIDGVEDERAAIVEGDDANILRKARCNLGDLLFDGIDDVKGMGAVARHNDTADRLFAILVEESTAELGPQLHTRNITHIHWSAIRRRDRNVFNVLELLDQPKPANHVFAVADFEHLGAYIVVAALHCREHIAHRDAVGSQLQRIDIDLILPNEAPDTRDLSHTGNRIELVLDVPVLNRMQSPAIVRAFHRIPEHLAHTGRVRPQHRGHSDRQEV